MIEQLDKFKQTVAPKVGYSIHVGISSDSKRFIASVFQKVEIKSKKYGVEIANTSVFNTNETTSLEAFEKVLSPYIVKVTKELIA